MRVTQVLTLLLVTCVLSACGGTSTTTVTVTSGGADEPLPASDQPEVPIGSVGDTLVLPDSYESDGVEKDDRLAFTLVEVSDNDAPNGNPYSIRSELPKGYKYLRAQVRVRQLGETESGGLTVDSFSAIDSKDQQYDAVQGEIFEPMLADGTLVLPPGGERLGYIAIPVPKDAEITRIEVHDTGYTPPSTAVWELK